MPALIDGAPELDVELYVGGSAFTLDDPELGRLDAGNVAGPTDDGWLDLTTATSRAAWRIGATSSTGPLSRIQPGYGTVELVDPTRRYDPGNPSGPYRGRFRVDQPARITARRPAEHAAPFVDDFTGPAGPLGAPWVVMVGTWELDGAGKVRPAGVSGGPATLALVELDGIAELVHDVSVDATDNGSGVVVGATLDPLGPAWAVRWIPGSGWWRIERRTASGAWSVVSGVNVTGTAGRVRVVAELAAGIITVHAPGADAPLVYATGAPLVGTCVGMIAGAKPAAATRLDNFTAAADVVTDPGWQRPQFVGRLDRAGWSAGITRLELVDGAADLAAYDPPEGNPAGAGELSGQRVARIAAEAGYRGPLALDAGTVECQPTALAQTALAELYRVADTELGALFVDRAGVLTFRDRRVWTVRRPALDELGPGDAAGVLVDVTASDLSRDGVANIIGAAGNGLTEQTATDPESVAVYGPRRYARRDLLLVDEPACQQWADDLLVWTRAARPGAVTRLRLWPIGAPRLWELVCQLNPLDPLRLAFTDVVETPLVAGYAHDVTARDWRVTVTLSPHPLDAIDGAPFTLDDPDRGRLDAGNVAT